MIANIQVFRKILNNYGNNAAQSLIKGLIEVTGGEYADFHAYLQDMSVRQEKFAGLIQEHLADIFMRHKEYISGVFVTISRVTVSPDLGYAKIYLSLFKAPDKQQLLDSLRLHGKDIRKQLAAKIRNQARIVPELEFFIDESLDYVFHMEEVFKQLNKQEEQKNKPTE